MGFQVGIACNNLGRVKLGAVRRVGATKRGPEVGVPSGSESLPVTIIRRIKHGAVRRDGATKRWGFNWK